MICNRSVIVSIALQGCKNQVCHALERNWSSIKYVFRFSREVSKQKAIIFSDIICDRCKPPGFVLAS